MSDAASVLVDGPWTHKFVSANGARFHVAVLGDGPLVLLLHDFPQIWWAWRAQLVGLAAAGYRVAGVDLRGFGASDKPPKGYDTYTATSDAAAVIRSLGEESAVVVGQGLGAWTAWAMPALQPSVARAVGALSMAHPVVMQHAGRHDRAQRAALGLLVELQWPFRPERSLVRDDSQVRGYLTSWSSPDGAWPTEDDITRYAAAVRLPFVAHSAAEYFRWIGRNQVRFDGPILTRRLSAPITVPVLHLHGADDGLVLLSSLTGSDRFVHGPYTREVLPDVGHFLSEEAADDVTASLARWLAGLGDPPG